MSTEGINMSNLFKRIIFLTSALVLTACGDNLNSGSSDTNVDANSMRLQFKLNNIEPMTGQHYEG